MLHPLSIPTTHQGLHDITRLVADAVAASGDALALDASGLCTVFVQHTSASLVIQENADPSARRDLEADSELFVGRVLEVCVGGLGGGVAEGQAPT